MTHDEYIRDPSPVPSLSASIAKLLITRSPRHAWMAHPRLNPNWQPEVSEKFDLGSAAHALLLEGADRMTVVEADDWRTKAAKEARDTARTEGKYPVLRHQYADVQAMVEEAKRAFAACSDLQGYTLTGDGGVSEHPVLWHEGETYFRAKFDRVSTDRKLILDYKTTECAEPEVWTRQIVKMGYDVQAAFYLLAVQRPDTKFIHMVQEVEAPYAVSFVGFSPSFVALGMQKVHYAITLWNECMTTGKWPSYSSRIAWADAPEWETTRWGM